MTRFDFHLGPSLCDQPLIQYFKSLDERGRGRVLQKLIVKDLQRFRYPSTLPRLSFCIRSNSSHLSQTFFESIARIPPRKRHDAVRFLLFQKLFRPSKLFLSMTGINPPKTDNSIACHLDPQPSSQHDELLEDVSIADHLAATLFDQNNLLGGRSS